MREYLTEAVVLDRELSGETDAQIFLYTKELGRITARARSVGQITSRLSSYLQPLRRITARLVEKNGFQIVDALPTGSQLIKTTEQIGLLQIIRQLTSEHHPDAKLWDELAAGKPSSRHIFSILGFDPLHAACALCERKHPEYFSVRDAHYYCAGCTKTFSSNAGLYRLQRTGK